MNMPRLVLQTLAPFKSSPAPPARSPELTKAQQNLQQTARALWLCAYSLLWIGLVPKGWQRAEYNGTSTVNGQEFHQTSIASYGLWDVSYQLTTGTSSVPYSIWGASQVGLRAISLVQATQALMLLAAITGGGVFLAHLRGMCARTHEAQSRWDRVSCLLSALQLIFTTLPLVTWKCIPKSAFVVFCRESGCLSEPASSVKIEPVSVSWVFVLIAAILSLFLVLTLARLVALSDSPSSASGGEPQGLEIITASTGFAALTGRRRAPSDKSVGKAGASGAGASIDYLPVAKAAGTPVKKPTNPAAPWLDE